MRKIKSEGWILSYISDLKNLKKEMVSTSLRFDGKTRYKILSQSTKGAVLGVTESLRLLSKYIEGIDEN